MDTTIVIRNIRCIYGEDGVVIKDSFRILNCDALDFCQELRDNIPYTYKRTVKSWAKEVIAHNVMYDANLYPLHVIDTDLNDDEKWYRLLGYDIIYFLYKAYHVLGIFWRKLNGRY